MNPRSAADAYRSSAVESAPPIKVVHMLYEGALRFLDQAEALDPMQEPAAFSEKLQRVEAIVHELGLSLEPEAAPELAENLASLYLFVEDRLHAALMGQSHEPLPAAREVLTTLLEGWKSVELRDGNAA